LRAEQTWIAMASFLGGDFTEVPAPGRILRAAADADSLAYETSAFGRSYVGEHMVNRAMLPGQAPDSVEEAFPSANAGLQRDHPAATPSSSTWCPAISCSDPRPRPPEGQPEQPDQPAPPEECTGVRVRGVVSHCRS
jgi:hypothetical protein